MTTDNAQANPLDTWRQFITDSERQWNAFFKEVLGTDQFSNSMNAWVEASLTVQRMVADQLERLYTTFNIPTHSDLVDLGERMKAIEDALVTLQAQTATKRGGAKRAAPRAKPPRTRKPAGAVPNKNGAS
jgi:hypothetical protein